MQYTTNYTYKYAGVVQSAQIVVWIQVVATMIAAEQTKQHNDIIKQSWL
jgi:hypothetical protein